MLAFLSDLPLLSLLLCLPMAGVSLLLLTSEDEEKSYNIGLFFSLLTFILSCVIGYMFDNNLSHFQFAESVSWFEEKGLGYTLGLDGISLPFLLLTTFLTPLCLLASKSSVTQKTKGYVAAFLMLETALIGVFTATDGLLFYIFFEIVLIPMFFIIGIWGGKERIYASLKFFLYTLFGSLFFLVVLIYLYIHTHTLDITQLIEQTAYLPIHTQRYLWLGLFIAFAIKIPMWPFHTWLPNAHVQAPTAGSMMLAGVLLKMGGYGFLRWSLPLFPEASHHFAPFVIYLSIIAVIYTSFVALHQNDMKKLIAYSSVAHMGFVTMGIFTFTTQGIEGAMIQMISHGVISVGLFYCVGVIYDRMHTREINAYGGLVTKMPLYAFAFMVCMMASIGLPGTSGFVGELLVMMGAFHIKGIYAACIAIGIILGAVYMLLLYKKIIFGSMSNEKLFSIADLSKREISVFAPLLFLIIFLGIYPTPLLDMMHQSVEATKGKIQEKIILPTL